MLEKLAEIEVKAQKALEKARDEKELREIEIRFLGKKGELTGILRGISSLPAEERPLVGQEANRLRKRLEEAISSRRRQLESISVQEKWEKERIDITLPGRQLPAGSRHPNQLVMEEIQDIFTGMGFFVAQGPEVENDYYNFEALNLPPDHPAREMQDSFYLTEEILLRTHTSPVQVRTMEKTVPHVPLRFIAPGKVYRRDDDATHSPMFHQVEGLVVDQGVSLADLKGTLLLFVRKMFGEDREIRLRPSFFPFTEPSAEVDISCGICAGKGCRSCGNSGWLEILGAGMVHPNVLSISGYNPEAVSGYAFGIGIERIVMLKYGIDDMRLLYNNDLRFLQQFRGGR